MTNMEIEQAAESNKRKIETSSTGNDDYNLKVKKYGGEGSSSDFYEAEETSDGDDYKLKAAKKDNGDHLESIEGKTERVSSASYDYLVSSDFEEYKKASQWCPANRSLAEKVVAYYNNEVRNNNTMEITWIRQTIYQSLAPTCVYFICFDAKLTAKDTKETKDTNCRAVLLRNFGTEPKVYSLKLGALDDKDIEKRFTWRPARMVVFSESDTELEPEPRVEKADSDVEYEDNDVVEDVAKPGTVPKKYKCCHLPYAWVRQLAREAVLHHNKKGGKDKMKLGKTREVFVHDLDVELYHIKFNARLINYDTEETKQTTCQAVVSALPFDGIKVWFIKFPFLEANRTGDWCCKVDHCMCGIVWNREEELLKYACPDWYFSSDDEQVECNKMKHESPEQIPPALTLGSTQN